MGEYALWPRQQIINSILIFVVSHSRLSSLRAKRRNLPEGVAVGYGVPTLIDRASIIRNLFYYSCIGGYFLCMVHKLCCFLQKFIFFYFFYIFLFFFIFFAKKAKIFVKCATIFCCSLLWKVAENVAFLKKMSKF